MLSSNITRTRKNQNQTYIISLFSKLCLFVKTLLIHPCVKIVSNRAKSSKCACFKSGTNFLSYTSNSAPLGNAIYWVVGLTYAKNLHLFVKWAPGVYVIVHEIGDCSLPYLFHTYGKKKMKSPFFTYI